MSDAAVATGVRRSQEIARRGTPWWLDLPALGGWALGFSMVVILGLSGGGYDAVTRGEAAIAAWWIVGAGIGLGALALPRTKLAWAALLLFGGLTVWTGLGLTWTESTERTVVEAARNVGYAGMLLLALAVCARTPARHLVAGVATGLVVVCSYALLTRIQPEWFGPVALHEIFPTSRRRLAQPLGYWNALAGLAAVALPLLLAFAGDARRLVARSTAAAFLPVVVLVIFLTVSRGGVVAAGLAVLVWFALAPDRLPKIALLVVASVGSGVVCAAAERRDALQAGLDSALARQQGDELQVIVLLVMGGVAVLTYGISLLERHAVRSSITEVPRRHAGVAALATTALIAIVFLAAGGGGWTSDRVAEFKGEGGGAATNYDNAFSRLQSVDSNSRYGFWVVARDAQREQPLTGTGPGTFEYVWAREHPNDGPSFVRDAHSLWAETLGEMGLVGFVLVVGFFLMALAAGAVRALRAADQEHRAATAAATAGLVAFVAIASVEWAWEMTVLGAAALVLVAVCVVGRPEGPLRVRRRGTAPQDDFAPAASVVQRVAVPVLALAAAVLVAVPTAGTADVRDSQAAVRAGDLPAAFADARSAAKAQPYSSSALLQEALVLERAGELERALAVAVKATRQESVNWRTWFVRSRLEARSGDAQAALRSFRRARELNPTSPIFAR